MQIKKHFLDMELAWKALLLASFGCAKSFLKNQLGQNLVSMFLS